MNYHRWNQNTNKTGQDSKAYHYWGHLKHPMNPNPVVDESIYSGINPRPAGYILHLKCTKFVHCSWDMLSQLYVFLGFVIRS